MEGKEIIYKYPLIEFSAKSKKIKEKE